MAAVSGLDPTQTALFEAWAQVYVACDAALLGSEHDRRTPAELRALERAPGRERHAVVAVASDGAVVGAAGIVLPMVDNTHRAVADVAVLPAHRRRGIGSRLLAWAEEAARSHRRTSLQVRTLRGADEHPHHVVESFARHHGFEIAQTVLRSDLRLPAAGVSEGPPPGVEIVTWADGTIPDEWLDERALLGRRMSTDAPAGDLSLEEEVWDRARVVEQYALDRAMGRRILTTVAIDVASHRLAGFTEIHLPAGSPGLVYQQDTLVLREHRDRGLGRALKQANTAACERAWPDVRRVRTWNADDNTHMLAVNRALGYVTTAVDVEWQKPLHGRRWAGAKGVDDLQRAPTGPPPSPGDAPRS